MSRPYSPYKDVQSAVLELRGIMTEFAAQTGLFPPGPPRRYLWTDAFAVCNFLELYRHTREERWRELALDLIDQVHHVLGRHRDDDPRIGWISHLSESEGEKHPTRGGLRIGKRLNERKPGEPLNESLKWDQDGQYYHYLTKWMHALNRVSRTIGDETYSIWALELAKTAHAAFTAPGLLGGTRRMYWKMSIDLTRPLVSSMGQHDPLDGYITYCELQATAPRPVEYAELGLQAEIAEISSICRGQDWMTDDALGIGGLLGDAWRIAQLTDLELFRDTQLLGAVISAALAGLRAFVAGNALKIPASFRLPFRELGLSIGLKGLVLLRGWARDNALLIPPHSALRLKIEELMEYRSLAGEIDFFWLDKKNREFQTWREHQDINMVMLGTSFLPTSFLTI